MIELALVLILLVMLLVGTVSAAIALGQNNSIHNAAREGSRFGATLDSVASRLSEVRDAAQAAALGDLGSGVPGSYICVSYINEANPPQTFDDPDVLGPNAPCYNDAPASEERVQVVTERQATINAVIFATDVTLRSEAVAKYERGAP